MLVHLEDGEVPGNAVVPAVDDDAGARLLRGRVVLRNHRPKEVGLSRDCHEGTMSIADVHATHWGSGPGVRTVCVVHALLGAQLDQRLSVFLKRAGGGDHHLFGRVAAAARNNLAVLKACAKEVGTFVFFTTARGRASSSAVVQTRSATSTGGC